MKAKTQKAAANPLVVGTIVFVAGALGMVLELVGSRLLAPYFGNSLFVWTSLIGVMLGFMSLGYFLGGRLADKHLDEGNLFWILAGAGIAVGLTTFSEATLLPALSQGGSLRLLAVVSAAVLFAVPSTLLGMVSPYSIRLRVHAIEDSGSTVGSLYALSTLGSIVGTFSAGFWLISLMGTRNIILLIAGGLGCLSLLVVRGIDWRRIAALGAIALMVVFGVAGVAKGEETVDTKYDRYFIRQLPDPVTGRPLIGLAADQKSAESVSYADTGEPYRFQYYDFYDLGAKLRGSVTKALVIGGGTFSYPRIFVKEHPSAQMDVVEIDPTLDVIAKQRFGFKDDPRIHVHFEDGRTYLNRAKGTYQLLLMDAFKSEQTVPYQLTTRESWKHCYDLLDDDGVLVMNVVASPTDSRRRFFDSLYATISDVFPNTAAFIVQDSEDKGGIINTSIIATKNPKADIHKLIAEKAPEFNGRALDFTAPAGTRVFTDDYAPVDQYLLGF